MQWRLSRDQWIDALLTCCRPLLRCLRRCRFWNCFHRTGPLGRINHGSYRGCKCIYQTVRSSGELAAVLLMMLAGAAGLGSLWLTILFDLDRAFARARRRYSVGVLVAGWAATVYWLSRLDKLPRELKAFWVCARIPAARNLAVVPRFQLNA